MARTIEGLNEGGLWSGDNKEIVVKGCDPEIQVQFRIFNSRFTQLLGNFYERYSTIGGVLRLRGLGDIAKAYFSTIPVDNLLTSQSVLNALNIDFSIISTNPSTPRFGFSQLYYYSAFPLDYSDNPDKYKLFLTRFHQKTLFPDQVDYISFIDHGQKLVIGVYYMVGTQIAYKTCEITGSATKAIYTRNLSLSQLVILLSENGVDTYEDFILNFDLFLYDEDVLIDTISYKINRKTPFLRTDLLYYNLFGCPEVLTISGQRKRSGDLGATFLSVDTGYQKVNTDLILKNESYTGYISADERDAVYDLVCSEPVYICQDGRLQRITILDIDFSETEPHTEPICLRLTYRKTDSTRQRTFTRGETVGSFDETFDNTFY